MAQPPTKSKTVQVRTAAGAESAKTAAPAAKRAPAFQINSSNERKRYLKLMVYGEYGVGKTFLAGTAATVPDLGKVLLLDAEAGDLTLDDRDIDQIRIEDYKVTARVLEFLKVHCSQRDIYTDPKSSTDDKDAAKTRLIEMESTLKGTDIEDIDEPTLYRTAIIDSLTEIETFCMYQLLGINDMTRLDEEVATAEWSEYKRNHSMIQRLVRSFRDLPMHVVICCAAQYVQDENKRMKFSPALTGKLSKQVQGFVDMVGFLVVGQPKEDGTLPRRLYIQPSNEGRYDAKNRFSKYKNYCFDDPTIESILRDVGIQP